jgi:hypothetical protein
MQTLTDHMRGVVAKRLAETDDAFAIKAAIDEADADLKYLDSAHPADPRILIKGLGCFDDSWLSY